ncbi:MAG: hypothetical protein B7Y45_08605 [Sphingomonas sp. 28-66-16]|nr:MAG: hypothetical protein B7Y45_08605 [Sphingomonas sp. 28-66-16]
MRPATFQIERFALFHSIIVRIFGVCRADRRRRRHRLGARRRHADIVATGGDPVAGIIHM